MTVPRATEQVHAHANISPAAVRAAMKRRLPGRIAQFAMATLPRTGPNLAAPRDAAVLLLLYPRDDQLHVLLTLRSQGVASHAGQVSLPGGARDGWEPLIDTALREAAEEVGVRPGSCLIIGALTPLPVPSSNYLVYPFVAMASEPVNCAPASTEVAELIEAPLSALLDPAARREEDWVVAGSERRVRFFQLGRHAVWGATAMILSELAWLLHPPDSQAERAARRLLRAA